jgi:hypothetical protein
MILRVDGGNLVEVERSGSGADDVGALDRAPDALLGG